MSIRSKTLRIATVAVSIAATTAFSGDWPNFHGPDRTNKSTETGLLKEWPKDGPALLWTASGLGDGYSGVSVSGGNVYTAGVIENINHVFAFDRAGKLLWKVQAGPAWEATRAFARPYAGSRSTPTVSQGLVYYLSDTGLLLALDEKTGAEKWSVNIREKYEAEMPMYGYSESPLVVDDKLYVAPYGKSTAVCLNKKTGEAVWASQRVRGDAGPGYAGYASFMLAENSGFKQLIAFTSSYLYGMNFENGKILWTMPFTNNRENNCTDIIFHDGHVLASSGYGRGVMLVKLSPKAKETDRDVAVKKVYDYKLMDNHHGGVILHNGHLYGSGHEAKGWFCLDFKTGAMLWNAPGKGSLTFAEGMLYLYDEEGKMSLVKAAPEKFTQVSSFTVPPGGKGAYWAHPVISNGVLYVRHADNLYAYNIKQK